MSTEHDRAVLNAILNPLMPTQAVSGDKEIAEDAPIQHPGIEESRALEKAGVKQAEAGDVEAAVATFSKAIEVCPVNPSAFNNRAQAKRLLGKVDESLTDLDEAIKLSDGKGRSGCQAYVQRAMIHRLKRDDDRAREDFQKAGDLGSSFAKMQAVALNPYAAMCNKMLAQVFNDLKDGKSTQ